MRDGASRQSGGHGLVVRFWRMLSNRTDRGNEVVRGDDCGAAGKRGGQGRAVVSFEKRNSNQRARSPPAAPFIYGDEGGLAHSATIISAREIQAGGILGWSRRSIRRKNVEKGTPAVASRRGWVCEFHESEQRNRKPAVMMLLTGRTLEEETGPRRTRSGGCRRRLRRSRRAVKVPNSPAAPRLPTRLTRDNPLLARAS